MRFSSFFVWAMLPLVIQAEMLAMVNYETKSEQVIRKEGIAIIDVEQNSTDFGKILMDIPLPYNLVNHHIIKYAEGNEIILYKKVMFVIL